MKNNAPTFAIIGKPNNGKSSIISALTFDDTIEISSEVGTTTKATSYSYKYKNEIICNFYDTPGFEQAKSIWQFIKNHPQSLGHNAFLDFKEENKSNPSMKKDIEILDAILDSDFIVFIINTSEEYNKNTTGYELNLIGKFIQKPILILLNKISDADYSDSWRDELKAYNLTSIQNINPLNSSYENITHIYSSLYSSSTSNSDNMYLDKLISTFKRNLKENIQSSIKEIVELIFEILSLRDEYKFDSDEDKKDSSLKHQNRLYNIEKKHQKNIEKIWGYHEVKVVDERANIDSVENENLGLSKNRLIILAASTGAVIGAPAAVADFGMTSALLGTLGGISGYLAGDKFSSVFISKKKIIYSIDEKNYNVSFILLKRSLEHLDRLISHGHANRTDIIIPKEHEKWKFNDEWSFTKEEEKKIASIHTSLVKDEHTFSKKEQLMEIVLAVIKREISFNT